MNRISSESLTLKLTFTTVLHGAMGNLAPFGASYAAAVPKNRLASSLAGTALGYAVLTPSGRPDLLAQDVLAILVKMASARLVEGSAYGDRAGWHGETDCDDAGFFHLSYQELAHALNCPKRRVKAAVVKLEGLGAIERDVRSDEVPLPDASTRPQSTLYLRVVPEGIAALGAPAER